MKKLKLKTLVTLVVIFMSIFSNTTDAAPHLNSTDTGNKSGLPVIFVHAFPLNQSMWDDQVKALKGIYRVITFDIRGLGKTKATTSYTLEFVVDDLIGLMDRLKIDKAVICGLSMGGFVALRAIERNPERFMGAVLANTKSESDSDSSKLGRYQALKTIQEQGLPVFVDSFIKKAIAPIIQTEKPQVLERAKNLAQSSDASGVSSAILALASRTDTTSSLEKIRIPVLVMQGEFDSVIPLAAARTLHEKIKGSAFFIVPKAGHLSNLENPEAFNARLTEFLAGVKR